MEKRRRLSLDERLGTFTDVTSFVENILKENSGIDIELEVNSMGKAIDPMSERYVLRYKNGDKVIKEFLEGESPEGIIDCAVKNFMNIGKNYHVEFDKKASTVSIYKSYQDALNFS